MRKSLFRKFFSFAVSTLLVAMVLLGTLVMGFAGNFWLNDKRQLLTNEAATVADQISDMLGTASYVRYREKIVQALTRMSGSEVLIADRDGVVVYCAGGTVDYTGRTVSPAIMEAALQSEYTEMGTLQGLLPHRSYVAGVPVTHTLGTVGVVFALTPSSGLTRYLTDMLQLFLMAGVVVWALVVLAIYLITASMVRPMREMAEAAHCMARGDFSRYIRVDREDEIGQLAVAFNNMTKSIAAGEQMRRGFVANVSHELKTPMTTISGFIDGILDGTIAESEQKMYLGIVSGEVKRLSGLVTGMLSLSKLEAGEMTLRPMPMQLGDQLVTILFSFDRRIEDKGLQIVGLDTLGPLQVEADPDLMHQVLYNLVENAVKYTPDNGTIWFSGQQQDGRVTLTIRNSGRGIPKEELPYVFDRFYKVDKSRGTDKMGAGLGLYLVKTILGLHGGQITVSSVEEEYTEFSFTVGTPRAAEKGEGRDRVEKHDRGENRDRGKKRDRGE